MKRRFAALIVAGSLFFIPSLCLAVQIPYPPDMPDHLKEFSPHHPQVVYYYCRDFVRKGEMTAQEGWQTYRYMHFRYARRQQDLLAVAEMSTEERRAYMKEKRQARGNPLDEYADYISVSRERARELLNLMHVSPKGDKYYDPSP